MRRPAARKMTARACRFVHGRIMRHVQSGRQWRPGRIALLTTVLEPFSLGLNQFCFSIGARCVSLLDPGAKLVPDPDPGSPRQNGSIRVKRALGHGLINMTKMAGEKLCGYKEQERRNTPVLQGLATMLPVQFRPVQRTLDLVRSASSKPSTGAKKPAHRIFPSISCQIERHFSHINGSMT
jgi:hypothetical protein